MTLSKLFKIGQQVKIELKDNQGLTMSYPSRVENMTLDALYLASPLQDMTPVYLPAGEKISVRFNDMSSCYLFQTEVIKSLNMEIPIVQVKYPQKIEMIQKREFVRVQYSLKVKVFYTDEEGKARETTCVTKDISGGGLRLVSSKPLEVKNNDTVLVDFEIEKVRIKTDSRLIWQKEELDTDGIKKYSAGLKFINLPEKERKHLVRCIYQRQIEFRRKGLL